MANVLVVDGDLIVLNMVTDVLESAEHKVRKAGSWAEALKLLKGSDHFDLLITNVALGDTAGVALIEQARSHHPGLPVMALSEFEGAESSSLRQSLRRLGVAQILRKPLRTNVLQEAISSVLGERR